ncbi:MULTISPECIES: two-component system response regulator BtsR [Shewanella]|uniref:two-component system response regulator BtsR n=1 Tax=Shewanella TaxID=22 RepID=UPI001BBBB806|nr:MULTISPECIES: two-component system response regulator BtsR [Shewanella]GIU53738.1 putative response regulatory protein [Shewanella sp. KT0246]
MISCLIIDDEPFARQQLADLLVSEADFKIIEQCSNAIDGLHAINKHQPQVIFLDIQMPRITGLELISMLSPDNMPRVVFVTAFDEYAVKAFDNNAFDYLLKPIEDNRFKQTIAKVRNDLTPQAIQSIAPEYIEHLPCYCGNKLKVVATEEVEFIYSDVGGIHVNASNNYCHTQLTLKVLEEKTPLVRCHKQYLLAPRAISEIELLDTGAEVTTHSGKKVPVSRRYLKPLKQVLGFQ